MLFAIWTENRATEETDQTSMTPSRHSVSIHSISRQSSVITPAPAVRLAGLERDDRSADIKIAELEADETLTDIISDDKRPAVFKSTFWEVCAVAALISAQLCNVYHKIVVVIVGIGACSTNCHSDFDSIFPFDHRTTGLGQCGNGNSCRFVLAAVWEARRYFWAETCAHGGSDDACRWWDHLWC
jgi:hypothetical protein